MDEITVNLSNDIVVRQREAEGEVVFNYAEDIVVKARSGQEVSVQLTQQGPQGPAGEKGDKGDLTPELIQARDQAIAAANSAATARNAAETAEDNALTHRNAAASSASAASTSKTAAQTAQADAVLARDTAQLAATNSQTAATSATNSAADALAHKNAAAAIEASVVTARNEAQASAGAAAASADAADDSATAANVSATAAQGYATAASDSASAADASKVAAAASETNALSHSNTASGHAATATTAAANAQAAKVDAENAGTAAISAKNASETARTEAQTAKAGADTAKADAIAARDAAQVAAQDLSAAVASAEGYRNEAESFAAAAAQSAAEAAAFDPSDYLMKANNGSDFADPAQVRVNIGAAAILEDVTQLEAEAGAGTINRNWNALRVRQAVAAYAPSKVHAHTVADITGLQALLDAKASLASPEFTGTPIAPTAAAKSNSQQIATTAYVDGAISDLLGGAVPETLDTIKELADRLTADGDTLATLTQQIAAKADAGHQHVMADIGDLAAALDLLATKANPSFTGTVTVPTADAASNTTVAASTEFVKTAIVNAGLAVEGHHHEISDVNGLQAALDAKAAATHAHVAADISDLAGLLAAKAALASPTFTGTVTIPTPAVGDNSTKAASTAYVVTAIANGVAGKSDTGHGHSIADVSGLQAALDLKAPLASPALTGTPTAPTQAVGNNSTRIATTAFVTTAVANGVADKANTVHSHAIGDITGLQAAIDAKLGATAKAADSALLEGLAPSDAATASTIAQRTTSGDLTARYLVGQYVSMSHSAAARNADTVFYSSTDNYIRKNTAAGFKTSLGITIADVASLQTSLDGKLSLTGGTMTGSLTGSGNIDFARFYGTNADSAAAPSFTNAADLNTGIWFPAADQVGMTTGGVNRVTVSSAGLVCTANITAYSDARLKTDIETIGGALDMIDQVRGVRYTMNGQRGLGVIAQELQKVAPELVIEADDEMKTLSVAYGNITGILIEAIKELRAEVNALKKAA